MLYIGMDVHSKWTTVVTVDPETGAVERYDKVINEQLVELVQALPGEKRVALEAGRNSFAIYDRLQGVADQVLVVDPTLVRKQLAGEPKTDRRDAKALAMLLAQGRLSGIAVPNAPTRELRELTRTRTMLVQQGPRLRNSIRALLARWGLSCSCTDLLGVKAQKVLAALSLPPAARKALQVLWDTLQAIEQAGAVLEAEVVSQAQVNVEAQRLMAIPGIGPVLAMSLLAEIGDPKRFATGAQLCAYSGLVPSIHQSGERKHTGPLTKRGNKWLRYAAVLAANQQTRVRADSRLRRFYYRQVFRLGPNPAKVATARQLLHLIHSLLIRPREFVLK